MNYNLPCKTCIVFPICRQKALSSILPDSSKDNLIEQCVSILCLECTIFYDYIEEISIKEGIMLRVPHNIRDILDDIFNLTEVLKRYEKETTMHFMSSISNM
jgi:hypothetical protein